jgi:uncharacterized iron-regulated membrane protein
LLKWGCNERKTPLNFVSEKEKNAMKINRFVALAVFTLLVVGTMGAVTYRAYAHGTTAPAVQTDTCTQDQADGTEVTTATDTDTVNLQCGDQTVPDTGISAAEQGGQETIGAADTDNANVEQQVGDQSTADSSVEVPEPAGP